MSIWQRLLAAIGRVLSAFFNIRIKLKYVLVLVILLVAGCIGVTYNRMINAVGGKADYDEAMRYIEIKDLVDEYFIDPADRTAMGNSAAVAMISALATSGATTCPRTNTVRISYIRQMNIQA